MPYNCTLWDECLRVLWPSLGLENLTCRHLDFGVNQESGDEETGKVEILFCCFFFSIDSSIRLEIATLWCFRLVSSAGRIQMRCYFQSLSISMSDSSE